MEVDKKENGIEEERIMARVIRIEKEKWREYMEGNIVKGV